MSNLHDIITRYKTDGNFVTTWLKTTTQTLGEPSVNEYPRLATTAMINGAIPTQEIRLKLSSAIRYRKECAERIRIQPVQPGAISPNQTHRCHLHCLCEDGHKHYVNMLIEVHNILFPRDYWSTSEDVTDAQRRNSSTTNAPVQSGNPFSMFETTPSPTESLSEQQADLESTAQVLQPPEGIGRVPASTVQAQSSDDAYETMVELSKYILECDNILRQVRQYWKDTALNSRSIMYSAALTSIAAKIIHFFSLQMVQKTKMTNYDEFLDRLIFSTLNYLDGSRNVNSEASGHQVSSEDYPFTLGYGFLVPHAAYSASLPHGDGPARPHSQGKPPTGKQVRKKIAKLSTNTHYPTYGSREYSNRPSAQNWMEWIQGTNSADNILFAENHCSSTHFSSVLDLARGVQQVRVADIVKCDGNYQRTDWFFSQTTPIKGLYAKDTIPLERQLLFEAELTMLLESHKSFVQNTSGGARNCHQSLINYAKEIQSEITSIQAFWKTAGATYGMMFDIDILRKTLEPVIESSDRSPYNWGAYSQAPWVAGARMLEINNMAAVLGLSMLTDKEILHKLLHYYNMLVASGRSKMRVPILEDLCELLIREVFAGHRPVKTNNEKNSKYRTQYLLSLGYRSKIGTNPLQIDLSTRKKEWDRGIDDGLWSTLYKVQYVGYQPMKRIFDWHAKKDLKVWVGRHENREDLRRELFHADRGLPPPEADEIESSTYGVRILQRMDAMLERDLANPSGISSAKINWLRVYMSVMEFLDLAGRVCSRHSAKIMDTTGNYRLRADQGAQLLDIVLKDTDKDDGTTKALQAAMGGYSGMKNSITDPIKHAFEKSWQAEKGSTDFYLWKNM